VLEAKDGEVGLTLCDQPPGSLDLLLTDIVLPGAASGHDVAAYARTLHPEIEVLFTSGYPGFAAEPGADLSDFLPKPFTPTLLVSRIRKMLREGSSPDASPVFRLDLPTEDGGQPQLGDNRNRLLLVDDDPDICRYVAEVGRLAGYEVKLTSNGEQFRAACSSFVPTTVVLDLVLGESDGVELLRFLASEGFGGEIILMSGMDFRVLGTARRLARALGLTVVKSLQKPVPMKDLEDALRKCRRDEETITGEDLRRALENDELVLEYQPIVSLEQSGLPIHATEALLRWPRGKPEPTLPDVVIPLAESAGLLESLTRSVLRMAVRQLREWRDSGFVLATAINLPTEVLCDREFPDQVASVLKEFEIDPALLSVEVTERAAMTDPTCSMDVLTRLRLKGVGLSIDDFGTGYSSLTQLYRMPFNELKFDRSLVSEASDDKDAQVIVETIVQLAHNLGMRVCAEGVETWRTLSFLRSLHCDRAQGWLISKSLQPSALTTFTKSWSGIGSGDTPER